MVCTIGILGGMGPLTTVDFVKKIIENTSANTDQEHRRMFIYINPKIPSRIDAILEGAISPLPELILSAKKLEKAGVDCIVITCNTAHYWYEELRASIGIPILNIIEITVAELRSRIPVANGGILLFATEATIKAGLYQKACDKYRITIQIPNEKEQMVITEAIKSVKAGQIETNPYITDLNRLIENYDVQGVITLIAGCTEISLLLPYFNDSCEKVDPLEIVSKKIVGLSK